MKNTIAALVIVCVWLTACSSNQSEKQEQLTQYVDPFIGTGGHGHTYPGAVLPFGMVQASPDNGTQGWDWCSGYHYSDSMIAGFSHTHLSGTGIGDLYDISILPISDKPFDTLAPRSFFSHAQEKASPGYYQVYLNDFKINAELTATERVALHRYRFDTATNSAALLVNLGFAINWDRPVEAVLHRVDNHTFAGYRKSTGWAKNQQVYFAIRSEHPVDSITLFADKKMIAGDSAKAQQVMAYLHLPAATAAVHHIKVAISHASEQGAIEGLATLPGYNFNEVRARAEQIWESQLQKIKIETTDSAYKRMFYTALYHSMLAPNLYSDASNAYRGADSVVHTSKGNVYSVFSLWDTFRGNHPLFTVLHEERVGDMVNSMLLFYEQHGLLPVWDLQFNETNTMTGYHAVPVIADAILKNIKGFDYQLAYKAMKASAMQNIRGTDAYRQYGFVPQDKHGWSVTMTLEYSFDDWCIAQVAQQLGNKADYDYYSKRSNSFAQLFDARTGFFRAKNSDSTWVEPFDPYYSEHGFEGMYIEGTAWQHTFFVPHAVDTYARLLGGRKPLIDKLDTLFATTSQMNGDNVSGDISGLIGQYAHGNEPSHHIAYMYSALGEQVKAAQRIRQIINEQYHDNPDGLSGNEDCGQMSAWLVWSMLGMYPMNPASGEYVFGWPSVDKATIALPNSKQLQIVVKRSNKDALRITEAALNGKRLDDMHIHHADMMQGGELLFRLE